MARRISERTKGVIDGFGRSIDKILGRGFTIEGLAEMEDEEFDMYRSLAKSYKEFSELAVDYSELVDEQTEMLESIQKGMNMLLAKK